MIPLTSSREERHAPFPLPLSLFSGWVTMLHGREICHILCRVS